MNSLLCIDCAFRVVAERQREQIAVLTRERDRLQEELRIIDFKVEKTEKKYDRLLDMFAREILKGVKN